MTEILIPAHDADEWPNAVAQRICAVAQRALVDRGFETQAHYCERWVRQVCQAALGAIFDSCWRNTAIATAHEFQRHAGLCVPLRDGSIPGDLLFKMHGSGGDGHVGIRIPGNRVAENSSVHWNGRDARGTRALVEFGNFDLIVRLARDPRLHVQDANNS